MSHAEIQTCTGFSQIWIRQDSKVDRRVPMSHSEDLGMHRSGQGRRPDELKAKTLEDPWSFRQRIDSRTAHPSVPALLLDENCSTCSAEKWVGSLLVARCENARSPGAYPRSYRSYRPPATTSVLTRSCQPMTLAARESHEHTDSFQLTVTYSLILILSKAPVATPTGVSCGTSFLRKGTALRRSGFPPAVFRRLTSLLFAFRR
jgi:hypothetical protein